MTHVPIAKPHLDFKQYSKVEESLGKEKYNLMEKHNLFEELKVDHD
jgi:hypothetical protein